MKLGRPTAIAIVGTNASPKFVVRKQVMTTEERFFSLPRAEQPASRISCSSRVA